MERRKDCPLKVLLLQTVRKQNYTDTHADAHARPPGHTGYLGQGQDTSCGLVSPQARGCLKKICQRQLPSPHTAESVLLFETISPNWGTPPPPLSPLCKRRHRRRGQFPLQHLEMSQQQQQQQQQVYARRRHRHHLPFVPAPVRPSVCFLYFLFLFTTTVAGHFERSHFIPSSNQLQAHTHNSSSSSSSHVFILPPSAMT
ncbi:hypothetical protein T01_15059 [Trichinella spiralis]|uniref:Uncharacterized protein n=1 Tax=Trichinella spiralis TaxID=6334 RepID=A0A0V1BLK1_TRISP|nr:hypothetical protein T01_15059 [Trichinella spiralis]